jgi:hypothetical protein
MIKNKNLLDSQREVLNPNNLENGNGDDLLKLILQKKLEFEQSSERFGKSKILMVDNYFLNLKSCLIRSNILITTRRLNDLLLWIISL